MQLIEAGNIQVTSITTMIFFLWLLNARESLKIYVCVWGAVRHLEMIVETVSELRLQYLRRETIEQGVVFSKTFQISGGGFRHKRIRPSRYRSRSKSNCSAIKYDEVLNIFASSSYNWSIFGLICLKKRIVLHFNIKLYVLFGSFLYFFQLCTLFFFAFQHERKWYQTINGVIICIFKPSTTINIIFK